MADIIIKFTYRLRNKEEFERIINKFSDYASVDIEYNKDNFKIDILLNKIEELKSRHGKINKLIIISNVKDILFLWNRLYNELGTFIFFIDKYNYNLLKTENLIESMEYNNKEDIVSNKIYLNISIENFENIIEDMFKMNSFKYFETLDKIVIKSKCNKGNSPYNKKNNQYGEKIVAIEYENNKKQLYLHESEEIFGYLYLYLIRKNGITNCRTIILELFKQYKEKYGVKSILKIKEFIIENEKILFIEKIGILSLMIYSEIDGAAISKEIFELLKQDSNKNINDYPAILINLLSYGSFVQFKAHNEIEIDYKELFDNVCNNLYKQIGLDKNTEYEDSKKIAVIVDSLHGEVYSATKFIKNIIELILECKNEYQIKIFVEDSFKLSEKENTVIFSKLIKQPQSFYFAKEHLELFRKSVLIEYFDKENGIDEKNKNIINSIYAYNPSVVLSTSLFSFSLNKIYEKFPCLYLSLGKINMVNKFDIELYPHLNKKKTKKENRYSFEYGIENKKSEKIYSKKDFNIEEKYFVMVTVGIRLNVEMSIEFIENIIKILEKNKCAIWFIVGTEDIAIIRKNYFSYIDKQIFFIKFEKNLGSFFQICNLYINPIREGGGFSIAEAILNDLPVLNHLNSIAGTYYCGKENSVKTINEYLAKIDNLIRNKNMLNELLKKEKIQINRFNSVNIIKELFYYIEEAKKIFYKRTGIVMEEK